MKAITESEVEEAAIEILTELGYDYVFGLDIAPGGVNPERNSYAEVVLVDRLRSSIDSINPNLPNEVKEDAIKKVLKIFSPDQIATNELFHEMITNGVDVEYRNHEGRIVGTKVWLFDVNNPDNNRFLAVNQFSVIEQSHSRRPDIVLFVNGLPLVLIELKNPADEEATVKTAYDQIQTYKAEIPSLLKYNEIILISDGSDAKTGSLTSPWEWMLPWKTIDGESKAPEALPQLEVVLQGMCNKKVLLDLIRNFIVFEKDERGAKKKLAAYHQYHAVNKAVLSTIRASSPAGDKRCGVVWHTQGSGKSLSMVFFTGKIVSLMNNPTVVVLTDRNDLDDQLYTTFIRCQNILRQAPVQAETRDELKKYLSVASGGIVFTTIQKFLPEQKGGKYPLLSDRRNIIVIADEAHRSQYDFIDGFARHLRDALPNASFIGFTGTPIESEDRSTPMVFGNYIDIYDIEQAVKDGATVPIYYENRLAKLSMSDVKRPLLDSEFEEVTEGEEVERKEKLKSKWAKLEAIVGSDKRIKQVAQDIVAHFEERQKVLEGKAMIVCMSRRICIDLYNEIINLRPEWHNDDDDKGSIKIVMTGSASDPVDWQKHIRNKQRRRAIGDRLKDSQDPLKIAIVRDMWLTGFDAPCLHTMYLDKPMRGHGLMQAIARVNRVYKDKPGGLVVDYLGVALELKKALADYTESGGSGKPTFNQEEAVAIMNSKYETACNFFYGFNYKEFFKADPRQKMSILTAAEQHILQQENGEERYRQVITELSKAFALSVPHEDTAKIADEVAFFQAVKSRLAKFVIDRQKSDEEYDSAIRQIISNAIVPEGVIDVFKAAGLKKPDVSILSEEFLLEIKGMEHKNLAFELLKKLLYDEIKTKGKSNLVQGKQFSEMLESAIRRYQNRSIEAAEVIEELLGLARDMRDASKKGKDLGLTEEELAFYDALETNDSAVKILGDEVLREIAIELVKAVRDSVTIDWVYRENFKAKMRLMVKKILKKYGYPPDKQEKATQTVLEQAKLLCKDWAEK
ncbi:MAG TPA: type I restriction endonuclease subunit R [Methanofastidiosum sp.]|jgi:type I restriction enzyme R subunit|nr:type I restriction endonuclease subunit R [Methanofastidiosum sp.]HPX23754.1 type I restriction endonuclease subunit R [Methanofastidiosum sp.]HQC25758.1 type I restriction endonuclease subunit R [Methanofastidiosum sp.]